jgi:hypothetical protein
MASFGTFLSESDTVGPTPLADGGGASYVAVHLWREDAEEASTSVVHLQVSMDGARWYRARTFTNVGGMNATTGDGGAAVSVPSWPFMRLYVESCDVGELSSEWFKR